MGDVVVLHDDIGAIEGESITTFGNNTANSHYQSVMSSIAKNKYDNQERLREFMGVRRTRTSTEKLIRRRSRSRHRDKRDKNHHYAPNCASPHNDVPQVPLTINVLNEDKVPKDCFGRDLELSYPRDCLGRRPSSRRYERTGGSKRSGERTKSMSTTPSRKKSWDVSSDACLADMHLLDTERRRERNVTSPRGMNRSRWLEEF
jgi:hypothetical protein